MIDKELIKKNFSRCAAHYDKYSNVQTLCAKDLIAKIKTDSFSRILEIGCGTGNYTQILRRKFPQAQIKAVDISLSMVKKAKEKIAQNNIEFIVADAEFIDWPETFNLISSNVSLQWFSDLPRTFRRFKALLNLGGEIGFSLFGPRTFFELNEALQELHGEDTLIDASNFIEKNKLEEILRGVFKKVTAEETIYQEEYNSLTELLAKIKYTGARGSAGNGGIVWTSATLAKLEKIYRTKFGNIKATYQAFFCKGIK
ncbi:MAG: malonyl-ACP O-methyltransferase BioC [Omnitrophica bacterium]|nr:malonyl-ACP O-methyltransferase BioC [Candidatus Omnitrophota bacterium]